MRERLSSSLLTKSILRIDFLGVTDIDQTVKVIGEKVEDLDLVDFEFGQRYINQVDFKINDPERLEVEPEIDILDNKKQIIYRFVKDNIKIEFGTFFLFIEVDHYKDYIEFGIYREIFLGIINVFIAENKLFKVLRIGLRKLDQVFLRKLEHISNYFDNDLFKSYNTKYAENQIVKNEWRDYFISEDIQFNLIRYIDNGEYQNDEDEIEKVYRVILDIDGYKRDFDKAKDIDVSEIINSINEKQFEIFRRLLTEDFFNILKDTKIKEYEDLIGIHCNE